MKRHPRAERATAPRRRRAAAGWLAITLCASALEAGPRIAPVTATCPGERPHHRIDAEGVHDRCVARATPECAAPASLQRDATGERDACATEPGAATPVVPTCPSGYQLRVSPDADVCERSGPARCPSGFKLKAVAGEDQCRR